ncbi:hypothetical protein BKA67DRAFT_674774 [Truncatella angustata]|uniref:Uncharacterized protein n=1 Tax=Truncatella angustata TaxID=152316 RepID=A0A9P8UUY7_9PEZI|nr:uncharacterized protein BKA67DRAFT_674774 [Truncatella angustata]KAH6658666.1 hypothetical protein BKA67DRAFT_674774 [Truncatella angustata]
MESYDDFFSGLKYKDMINAKTVIPAVQKRDLDIHKQAKYLNSLSISSLWRITELTRNHGAMSPFSLNSKPLSPNLKTR